MENLNLDKIVEIGPSKPVDIRFEDVAGELQNGRIYKKIGNIRAVVSSGGEEIETITVDGSEAKTVARAGEYIVTNPTGESYVVPADKFADKYESTSESGVYHPKGLVRGILNPTGGVIRITTQGERELLGDADAMLVVTCNPVTGENKEDLRLVNGAEFEKTYQAVEEELGRVA